MKPILVALFFCTTYLFAFGQLKGTIENYNHQPITLYKCYGDTLILIDSIQTDKTGAFTFSIPKSFNQVNHGSDNVGLYKVVLQRNQWFYILYDASIPIGEGWGGAIKTLYSPSPFYNIATDSLSFSSPSGRSGGVAFYEFQHLQQSLMVANGWLLQMMRLYPLQDPFHATIEKEYLKRYEAMDEFVRSTVIAREARPKQSVQSLANLIALAYYTPINPDWQQPDPWRDSIIATHYFDYFNPADSFYLYTNILPEKMDYYLKLRTNKRDNYGQPINDPNLLTQAAKDFIEKTKTSNLKPQTSNFNFCLSYLLKIADKEHKDLFFLSLYDEFLQTQNEDCGTNSANDEWAWARVKANLLRGVQVGSIAPDFDIEEGKLKLSSIESDYTLLIFWASWCPHCTEELPKIKKVTDAINSKLETSNPKLTTIAVSLDTDQAEWQKYVQDNNLFTWLNTSELKGWKGNVPKQYNVYATPTMFLLDKDKKIIAKPENAEQLLQVIEN